MSFALLVSALDLEMDRDEMSSTHLRRLPRLIFSWCLRNQMFHVTAGLPAHCLCRVHPFNSEPCRKILWPRPYEFSQVLHGQFLKNY